VLPAIQGGRVRNRYLYVALFPFGLLSVLSKENGVLLLVAILSLHFTVVPPLAAQRHYRYWFLAGILLPLVIVVSFIAFNFADLTAGYRFHEFNLLERLLTETRVLCQSFAAIFLPVISEFTLFHDDIVISSGLLSPLSTLFSALFVVSLVTLAFVVRRRQPVLSFGLFWFFGWHLLESTFLPLELYFEHRNYLAMLGPVIVAAYYGASALERVWKPGTSRGGMALAVLIPLICLLLTLQLTLLWRDDLALKGYWAERHPASFRAQVEYSYALAQRGQITAHLPVQSPEWLLHRPFPDHLLHEHWTK
jgi:hypothetical protein